MRRVFYWLGALIVSSVIATTIHSAYAATESTIEPTAQIAQQTTATDFAQHFQDLDVKGSILIYDQNQDRAYQYNPERNATHFYLALPSKFSIL